MAGRPNRVQSPTQQGSSPSSDRRLNRDRPYRAGAGAAAVRDLHHHLHDLPDEEGAEGVAARIERGAVVEARVHPDHLPLHQLRRRVDMPEKVLHFVRIVGEICDIVREIRQFVGENLQFVSKNSQMVSESS